MSKDTELLTEIRDLLQVIAEPLLAKRDEKFRAGIRKIASKGKKYGAAILLMDGTCTKANIARAVGMDASQFNRLVKVLEKEKLCAIDGKNPKLPTILPPDFFDQNGESNE